jgi:dephospho-CoA kinase
MAGFSIALSGGVASGKSEVGRLFQALGAGIADADLAAREIVAPGQPALAEIVVRFGPQMLDRDGGLDRRKLRGLVFSDAAARRDLEAITHPRIRQHLRDLAAASLAAYVLVIVPLLAEGGGRSAYPWLDRILIVDAPLAVQLARLCRRDGIDDNLAREMIAAQASRKQRLALADDVIVNDAAASDLDTRVRRLDRLYRRLAGADRSLD